MGNRRGSATVDIIEHSEGENSGPTMEEIKDIVKMLKNNKSAGTDNTTAEMFKYGGEQLIIYLHKLLEDIWATEQLPKEWNEAVIHPIHKKGDKRLCGNYRGIALLNIGYKILATLIKNRLTKTVESKIGEYQSGFRKRRSVTDQIFILREIQAESYEHQKETMVLSIDFKQAYDRVKREQLFRALVKMNVCPKLINLIKLTLAETTSKVQIKGKMTESFTVNEGLRQGDPLSPILFNIVLEHVIREAEINRSGLLYYKRHQCLAFADDVVILTRSIQELKAVFLRLEKEASKMGLMINQEKTKFIRWSDRKKESAKLEITTERESKYSFDEVDSFTYLGTLFSRVPNLKNEIQERLLAGNRCLSTLNGLLRSKNLSRKLKVRIYKTVIRPIVTYGSEVWVIGVAEQQMIEVWERKILRKIFGGKKVDGLWLRRSNQELTMLYNEPNITGVVKAQRLRWLGHVMRMEDSRTPKLILDHGINSSKRRRGRPKKRWKRDVYDDLDVINVKNWKSKVRNRKEWRTIVDQAMGLLGLQS